MCSSHSPSCFVESIVSVCYEAGKVVLEHTVGEFNIAMHGVDDSIGLGWVGFGILLLTVL